MLDRIPVTSLNMNGLDINIYQLTSLEFSKGEHLIATFKNSDWLFIDQDGEIFDNQFIKDILIEHIQKSIHQTVENPIRYFELEEVSNE